MSAPAAAYKRLPGWSRRLGANSRLYLAPGHLMLVESTGYSETYRRFYFADIEAILVRPTRRRLTWNLILTPLAIPPLLPALFGSMIEAAILGTIFSFPLLILVLINSLRGKACTTHIQTATQTTPIRSLGRLRAANRTLDIITPLIEQAQGPAGTAEVAGRVGGVEGETPGVLQP